MSASTKLQAAARSPARGLLIGIACGALGWAMINVATAAGDVAPATASRPVSLHGITNAPDISGLWLGTLTAVPGQQFGAGRGPADGRPPTYWAPWPLPYTPAYQEIYDARVAAAKAGRQLGDNSARCLPFGLPMMLVSKVYPDEIVQTPGQVTFFMNNTFPVVIWTDGRQHPANLAPSYNGHSIGHWIGDTLNVDTVGIEGSTALDVARNPHSAKLHIQWTIRRVAPDTLHLHVTLYDDEAFTEPVTTTNIWQRKSGPGWEILDDASCFENNREVVDKEGAPGFHHF